MAELILAPATMDGRAARLVDAATVARRLGVDREWVYAHANDLGAIRLGGQRGRLRFDLDQLDHHLAAGQRQAKQRPTPSTASRRQRRTRTHAGVELLPY